MKTDSLMNALTQYIDKRFSEIYSNAAYSRSLYNNGDYNIKIGSSSDALAIYFREGTVNKMALGMVKDKDGNLIPGGVVGAGDGYGNDRGYFQKGTDGFDFFYIGDLALSEVSGFSLRKDGIYTTHPITVLEGLADEFVIDATNWNAKLEAVDLNDPDNPKLVAIVKECVASINADVIVGNTLSTYGFGAQGGTNDYIVMNKQMMYYKEASTNNIKMAQGFLPDNTGTNVPCIILGTGAGNDSSVNKGFISKDTNGLNMFLVSTSNTAQGITIKSDGIYCTSELKLNTALADSYIASSSAWINKMQKLNSSGNFGITTGVKRVEISDTIIAKNSSNQNNGLYVDPKYSDLLLYNNGTLTWNIIQDVTSVSIEYGNSLSHVIDNGHTYCYNAWSFTNATVTGLTAVWG